MMIVFMGKKLSEVWLKIGKHLIEKGEERSKWKKRVLSNVILEIENIEIFDEIFHQRYKEIIGEKWAEFYSKLYIPLSSRPPKSPRKGTFEDRLLHFGKLRTEIKCSYCGAGMEYSIQGYNQLERIIRVLKTAPRSSHNWAVILNPVEDFKKPPFKIPGLVAFNVVVDGYKLNSFAVFRSQDFVRKAYGNYLWFRNLLNYLAKHTSYKPGSLTCFVGNLFAREKELPLLEKILDVLEA